MSRYLFFILFTATTLFSSSLDELVSYALEHSHAMSQNKTDLEIARQNKKASTATRLGSFDLVGSYTHYNLPRTLAPLTPASIMTDPASVPTTKNLFSTGIEYSVALFTGFAQTQDIEMSKLAEKFSAAKLTLTKEELLYNVASLYLSILSLEDQAKAQKKHIEALEKLLVTVEQEVKLGKKAEIDLLKTKKEIYSNRAYYNRLQSQSAITKAALGALVGKENIEYLEPMSIDMQKSSYELKELQRLLKESSRVKLSRLNFQKALKKIQKSKALYYPQIGLSAYYGFNYGKNDTSNQYSGEFHSQETWQVGLNAKWQIYDFSKRSALVQKEKIAAMQAQNDEKQTLLDLNKALTQALWQLKEYYGDYEANKEAYKLAKKSEAIELLRYNNGVATINDLLLATAQSAVAKAALIDAKYNYQKGKFYMNYILERGFKDE